MLQRKCVFERQSKRESCSSSSLKRLQFISCSTSTLLPASSSASASHNCKMFGAKSGAWLDLLICLFCLLASMEVRGEPVPMILLKSAVAKGAVCLDGTPPAFDFAPGWGSGAHSWMIHVEGGAWCANIQDCLERKGNSRGSSNYMRQMSFSGFLGHIRSANPDFYNWNRVKVRYCDGSSFTGDVKAVDPTTKLYFRGARIWRAIMDELLARGMNKAENALLSGCSAGGLAAILHCDKFRNLLPPTANVKCFSDAGFFIHVKDINGAETIKSLYTNVVNLHGSAKHLPSSCTSKMTDPSLCFFPQYVAATMSTPLFILNSAYDYWQIRNILLPSSAARKRAWRKCSLNFKQCSPTQFKKIQGFRSLFLRALPNTTTTGLFIDSCYAHCQSAHFRLWTAADSPLVDNTTLGKAVGDWFFGRSVVRRIDCPYPCNPSCQSVTLESNTAP